MSWDLSHSPRLGLNCSFSCVQPLYERVAVIVTTNLRFAEWNTILGGDERMSAALLDRLTHRATILEFVGTSFRFRQQLQRQERQDDHSNGDLLSQQE